MKHPVNTPTRNERRRFIFAAAAIGLPSPGVRSQPASSRFPVASGTTLKVRIIIGDKSIPVTLGRCGSRVGYLCASNFSFVRSGQR